ncbi:hypothetical protein [Pararhizobium antarcticum]|uniref:Uncharacterized protein n=1 Tax=Pararhizobium antarcticum TaxID=1798805 RepID=A0A657LVA7_9HYPH|nr:hypothetical protein [Pararhizobium antarcticum]OJF99239.1 hypothetical protein AX760_13580 [Pararhizobium antarcticum]
MAPQNSTVLVLTTVELAMGAFVYALLVANDVEQPGSVAANPMASLLQLCRDGSAQMPERFDGDINVMLQRHEKARTACYQLVNASDLEERDLAEALLDRADLDAPGEADVYTRALVRG